MSLPDPQQLIQQMADSLKSVVSDLTDPKVIMVGIHTGGAWIAEVLHQQLKLSSTLGSLGINFYRDDFTQNGLNPVIKSSNLPDIEGATVILVDDVIMSGRTIRAALNELFDYGRPEKVLLACLLDVGQRELPIQPDVCGTQITLASGERIKLSGPEPITLNKVTTTQKGKSA